MRYQTSRPLRRHRDRCRQDGDLDVLDCRPPGRHRPQGRTPRPAPRCPWSSWVGLSRRPLLSTEVGANDYLSEDTGGRDDDPYVGWWVGSDDNWHPPQEAFGSEIPGTVHPIRRVAVVILAIALVGATSVGVWEGASSSSDPGPSPTQLAAQVRQIVTGTDAGELGIAGVSGVQCSPPDEWSVGSSFSCKIDGSSHEVIGHYEGTVESPTSSGQWRWNGVWKPNHTPSVID